MPQITMKKMVIYNSTDPSDERISGDIGAEAQYVDIARDRNDNSIVDINTEVPGTPSTAFYRQPLSDMLRNIENNYYKTTDEILEEIADEDHIPIGKITKQNEFVKKSSTWNNIISKIKGKFGIDATVSTQQNTFLHRSGQWIKSPDTWIPNTSTSAGYVANPNGQAHRVWQTDENGNPGWTSAEHIPFHKANTLDANSSSVSDEDGIWEVKNSITSNPPPTSGINSGGILWNLSSVNTPYQMYMPDSSTSIFKRVKNNDTWEQWTTVDSNSFRPVVDNLNSTNATQSLSANQGRILGNAIVSIARNGTTFTATQANGGTLQFNQQDNNTTYSAGSNITLSGTTFSLTKANVTGALGYTPPTSMRPVVDNLGSTSTNYCLSANQGRVLNGKFTDGSVTKIGTSNLGGSNQPIYLNAGSPTACNTFIPSSGGTFTGNVAIVGGNSRLTLGNSSNEGSLRIYKGNGSYVTLAFSPANSNINRTLNIPQTTKATAVIATNEDLNYVLDQVSNQYATKSTLSNYMPKSGGTFTGTIRVDNPGNISYLVLGNDTVGSATSTSTSGGRLRLYDRGTGCYSNLRFENDKVLTTNKGLYIPLSTGTIQVGNSSSKRIKENIKEMSKERARKLLDIEIVNFDYIDGFSEGKKDQSGVIAEDAVKIIPEAVHFFSGYDENKPIDDEKNPSPEVDYRKFIPYLIKMVQIQQKEIDELKAKIKGD